MPRLVCIISLIFLVGPGHLLAQEDSITAEVPEPIDTLVANRGFALELSADYGKLVESILSDQNKWEFGLSGIINNKLAITGEYGSGKLLPASVIQNGSYESTGTYYRFGLEYSFSILPKHYLAIGGMYANATFSDRGTVQIQSELWPDVNEEFTRSGLKAAWAEAILNSQGPVVNAESGFMSNLYWGIRFRARIMITNLERSDYDIYAIPGYGKTYSRVVPAANLFLRYRLAF
jgi:hypothetical protein